MITGRWTYDPAGRLLRVRYRLGTWADGSIMAEAVYSYDAAGNRLSRSDMASHAAFSYDGLYQLTGDADSADERGPQTFAYDLAGNRTQQTIGSNTLTYSTPNDLNRLAGTGAASYLYDAEGTVSRPSIPSAPPPMPWTAKTAWPR